MNRRSALKYTLLGGAVLPVAAHAQDPAPIRSSNDDFGGSSSSARSRARSSRPVDDDISFGDEPIPGASRTADPVDLDSPPANFKNESGHAWRTFDIARYTSQAYSPENPKPQNSIVEWIFRRTGSSIWHGEKIAVLSAGRTQLRAYHNPRVLDVVQEYVERFTKATTDVLSVRVRFVAAQDTRWRYAVYSRLQRIGTGPHGQQVWTVSPDDANLVRTQMMLYQGFKLLADKTVKMLNGQTLAIETSDTVDYISGVQSEGAAGGGAQPKTDQIKEGASLRFSPLLTYDGDALDAAIEMRATTVRRLIRTKILARRDVGPTDVNIDVPEVIETRLNQTIDNWQLGQTVLITTGIAPGILQAKTGFLNLRVPGTVPTDTELLVFLDVQPVRDAPRASRRRAEPVDDGLDAEEPPFEQPSISRRPGTRREE